MTGRDRGFSIPKQRGYQFHLTSGKRPRERARQSSDDTESLDPWPEY